MKLELPRDNLKKFYEFIKKKTTSITIEITIYDEETIYLPKE